ncbi:MAG TPA: mechanosensitive ion channel family protein [Nocardioidaceae bacterium]|nr:mechanosensitive ion channel family protein [Nocardioidaceae bacterium]
MNVFSDASVCEAVENGTVCNITWDLTHSDRFALMSDWLIGKPLAILGLIVLGLLARWLLHRLIDRLGNRAGEGVLPSHFSRGKLGRKGEQVLTTTASVAATRRVQRAKTMASLLKSIVTVVILALITMMAISELGYDVAPLIASAGILGLALGFGAQSLVKDYLAGIFMIFEDQYGVGDVVDLGEATGTIEAVSLRVTRLRDVDGTVWYVRNGEILRVGNMSQNWARTVLDIPVAYSEDLHRVQAVLREVAHSLWDDEDYSHRIIEEPEVWGVQSLTPDGVIVRVTLKTAPMEQWEVAREMRERVKARFDFEKIEIPLPQRVVWHRDASGVPQPASPPERPAPEI